MPAAGISIHALREESDSPCRLAGTHITISIHALREESDKWLHCIQLPNIISIHALREESDTACEFLEQLVIHFNPRSP